ncbi:hypothetical protein COCMIDRAFT_110701, partial [Bipolaris oryzae ATCC 44560]
KVQFELSTTRVIMKSIHPYILIASSHAIPRRPAIPRMVALGGMAHHVTQPRDDHCLLTWTSLGLQPSRHLSRRESFLLLVTVSPVLKQ